MGCRLKYDLHTHTTYSRGRLRPHAKGSVLDNVRSASEKGLTLIGISDHGPGHKLYGMSLSDIPDIRRDIEKAKAQYPDIEVLLSVEANIINPSGRLDVSKEDQKLFDYIIAGYHYGVLGEAPLKAVKVCMGGYIKAFSDMSYNTDMVVRALYENDIRLLTHPGDKIAVDIDEVSRACEKTNTMMEINNHHDALSAESLAVAAKYDVSFVISSDAHAPENVGTFERALQRAVDISLPLERIVNLWSF